ncbi:transposase [Orientia tsutsugamushi]|uniref:transposase n=1 Tax=Orientia tsutsugamushi TaxID=784 RepID=UPI0035288E10
MFNSWIEQNLIPKLSNNSIVVIDNASYHTSPHLKTMIEKDGHIYGHILEYLPLLEYLPSYSHDLKSIKKKLFQTK